MYPRLLSRDSSNDQESSTENTASSFTTTTRTSNVGNVSGTASGRGSKKNISTACAACKKRKGKCSGEPAPCLTCRQSRTECIFDESKDRRRKNNKESRQEFQSFKIILDGFIKSIRKSEDAQLQELVTLILIKPSRKQLIDYIESSSGQLLRRRVITDEEFTMLQRAGKEVLDMSDESPSRPGTTESLTDSTTQSIASDIDTSTYHEAGRHEQDESILRRTMTFPSLTNQISDMEDDVTLPRLGSLPHFNRYEDIWSTLERLSTISKGKGVTVPGQKALQQYFEPSMLDHLCLPALHEDDNFLSSALTGYRNAALSMLGSGMPLLEVFGPDQPNVDLLFRERAATDPPNVCNWLCSFMRGFPFVEPTLKLCSILWLTCLLRWLIVPSVENYAKVPEFLRPTSGHAGIGVVLFHMLQDTFSSTTREHFVSPLSTIAGPWPKTMESSVEYDRSSGFMHATLEFEQYASDVGHRTRSQQFTL